MTTSELEEIARENAIQAAIDRLLHSDDLMDGISAVRAMLTNPPAAPRQPGEMVAKCTRCEYIGKCDCQPGEMGAGVRAQDALRWIMRQAESAKEPCSDNPESPAAIRNGKLAGIATAAAQALGLVRGPSYAASAQQDEREAWRQRAESMRNVAGDNALRVPPETMLALLAQQVQADAGAGATPVPGRDPLHYTGGCFIRYVHLPDGVKMEHVAGDTWRVILAHPSPAAESDKRDAQAVPYMPANTQEAKEYVIREDFESWAKPRGYSLERTTDSYKSQGTKSAWRGWRAAMSREQSQEKGGE